MGTSVWGVAGGDFVATPSAQASVTATGPVTFSSPQLLADVRAMGANASANHGWIIRNADKRPREEILFSSTHAPTALSPATRVPEEIGYTTLPLSTALLRLLRGRRHGGHQPGFARRQRNAPGRGRG